jgi:flagellum-specific peptidoglycan hydrolase FlgJ
LQQGGYATDPDYADKIVSLAAQIEQLNSAATDGRATVNAFKSAPPGPLTEPVPSKVNSNG